MLVITIRDIVIDKNANKKCILDIATNNEKLQCIRDKMEFNILDISSHEIRTYKASIPTKSVDHLQDNTEYTILGLCKHPFRTGFKYVLKVKENAEKSYPVMCKSSYYIEQLLNLSLIHI